VQTVTSLSNEYSVWTRDPEAEILLSAKNWVLAFAVEPYRHRIPGRRYPARHATEANDARILYIPTLHARCDTQKLSYR
jgi:hypothetical protein